MDMIRNKLNYKYSMIFIVWSIVSKTSVCEKDYTLYFS